jgi:hypothetical protein
MARNCSSSEYHLFGSTNPTSYLIFALFFSATRLLASYHRVSLPRKHCKAGRGGSPAPASYLRARRRYPANNLQMVAPIVPPIVKVDPTNPDKLSLIRPGKSLDIVTVRDVVFVIRIVLIVELDSNKVAPLESLIL